jgi:HD superfamily phosphohydrolase
VGDQDALRGNPYEDEELEPLRPVHKLAKTFTLPVSDGVQLYGPEVQIIDTAEFQRLDGVKQLGTSYLVFRGARHTRYEHSIGTLHRAEQMIQALLGNPRGTHIARVTPGVRRVARLACLLHDLPHVPFGHTLEDEFGLLPRHDRNHTRFAGLLIDSAVGTILREALPADEYEVLLKVLQVKGDDVANLTLDGDGCGFIADIVGNTLCADLLDYVPRDLAACGMSASVGDHFLRYLTITPDDVPEHTHRNRLALAIEKRGMPRPDVESEVIKLLTHRYELAERVYFHHAKNAASVMLGRAVVDAGLLEIEAEGAAGEEWDSNFWWLSDDLLLEVLINPAALAAILEPPLILATRSEEQLRRAADLARAVKQRRLYKPVYLGVSDDLVDRAEDLHKRYGEAPRARIALENHLSAQAGCEEGEVLLHLPRPQMMTKAAEVRVMLTDGTVHTLDTWDRRHSGRVAALNIAHQRLWRIAVYLHPDRVEDSSKVRLLQAAAHERFGTSTRLRAQQRRVYREAVWDEFAPKEGWEAGYREQVIGSSAAYAQDVSLVSVAAEMREHVKDLKRQSKRAGRKQSP